MFNQTILALQPSLPAMQVLSMVQAACDLAPQSEGSDGEQSPFIGGTRLPWGLRVQMRKILSCGRKSFNLSEALGKTGWFDYSKLRQNLMNEIPVGESELSADNLTHRLAHHFPSMPLRNMMITTGGPVMNDYFVYVVMKDLLDRFNHWSVDSGFRQFVRDELAAGRYSHREDLGATKLEFGQRFMWSGMCVQITDTDRSNRIYLAIRSKEDAFYKDIYDARLDQAVQMLEHFMQTWKVPQASHNAA